MITALAPESFATKSIKRDPAHALIADDSASFQEYRHFRLNLLEKLFNVFPPGSFFRLKFDLCLNFLDVHGSCDAFLAFHSTQIHNFYIRIGQET